MNERKSKMKACLDFFGYLSELLKDQYIVVKSCNNDSSAYLVPIGTEKQITYKSKPERSFRVSDHWNWKANLKKNEDEHYIQCFTRDLPWCKKRNGEGLASDPVYGVSVCYFLNGEYHVLFGEIFDRKTKTWDWIECEKDEAWRKVFIKSN